MNGGNFVTRSLSRKAAKKMCATLPSHGYIASPANATVAKIEKAIFGDFCHFQIRFKISLG